MKEIKLTEPWKRIVWTTTTVCNFACSYCAPNLHDGKYRWPDSYDKILAMISKFRGDAPLIFDVMGGEPTLWPEFQEFCKELAVSSTNKTSIQFTSNGSRTLRYWNAFDAPVDMLGFSFHPQFANEEHMFAVLRSLHLRYNTKIFLMTPPGYLERMSKFYDELEASELMTDVAIKLIKDNMGGGLIAGYTDEYHEFASKRISRSKHNKIKVIDTSDVLLDGEKISPQTLINTKRDMFEGWKCNIGIDRLAIEPNGDVFGSTCYVTKSYGNIYDIDNVKLPIEPTVCIRKYCGCGADISIPKVIA